MNNENASFEEHPEDRESRLEGTAYGKAHAEEFMNGHMKEMISLISEYSDNRAQVRLEVLREKFWSREWKSEKK